MNRRTFLKIASVGSVAFAAGCSPKSENNLFTMVRATEDMVTGAANWYASTCRECPAGCGVLAKNREGRIIKLEGNPLHPVNRGALCIRGQAALQGLYNPDRLWQPQLKTKTGWRAIAFEEAQTLIGDRMTATADGGNGRIAMITETVGQTQLDLFATVLKHFKGRPAVIFEPLAYESLKFAHQQLWGTAALPSLHMDRADMLLGFGADFLETWLSPVEYARKFKAMHLLSNGRKGVFIQVSPFQSLTGANADRWIGCRPGTQAVMIMGLIRSVIDGENRRPVRRRLRNALSALTAAYTPEAVTRITGISTDDQAAILRHLLAAKRPLVLGAGAGDRNDAALATELAALFLNLVLDPELSLFDFDNRHRVEIADRRATVLEAFDSMDNQSVELVLLNNVNPVYAIPDGQRIAQILNNPRRFVVAFTNFMDDTAAAADLVIPVQLALETWDAYESTGAAMATLQPTMGKITSAPALGDLLLNLLPADRRPTDSYQSLVIQSVMRDRAGKTAARWLKTIQRGGQFTEDGRGGSAPSVNLRATALLKRYLETLPTASDDVTVLMTPPSLRFFDGRGANRPWLIETPDTLTQISWQTTALVHPDTLTAAGLQTGDGVILKTELADIEVPAYAYAGVYPGTVVVPAGQGHTVFGRWASGQGVNPLAILNPTVNADSGAPSFADVLESMEKSGRSIQLASTSGSRVSLDRKIALSVPIEQIGKKRGHQKVGLTMDSFPLTLPTPEGYDPKRDIYPPHDHDGYRWAMIVDMDRCIGCSACVAACYAENNIGIVGEQRIQEGREMAWLQIQRYHDTADTARLTFLPMMCQHCDNAPCEAVCPVYAPHHNKEGLNNQIYNRCIGTRYCAQNCPYKVRRFNWFDWQWPKPLDMQLNPNVTVRIAGVMEKCSFCIQRIKTAHNVAKNEKRAIRDGEVVPACVQTCPTNALTFGSLMDKSSRVSQLCSDPRAYQVMGYLNVKPAVIYLKKVTQTI